MSKTNPGHNDISLLNIFLCFQDVLKFVLVLDLWHVRYNHLWEGRSEEWMLTWLLT